MNASIHHPSICPSSITAYTALIRSVFHAINHYHCTALFSYQLPVSLNMNVFGLWEEARVGGKNPQTRICICLIWQYYSEAFLCCIHASGRLVNK